MFSVQFGYNYVSIKQESWSLVNLRQNQTYKTNAWTPTVSLVFKPLENITTYVTYVESLENGVVVASTYANAGETLPPLKGEQIEVGVKAEVGGVLLTGALFQIDKGLQYGNASNYYVQDGRQRNKGFELAARGRLFGQLTFLGGVTALDATMVKTQNGTLDGKKPTYMPDVLAKLYVEWDLPFLEGLTLTGGIYHNGEAMGNALNLAALPSYTTGDLGLRYQAAIYGLESIFRLNVNNITNKGYWAAESGSDVTLAPPRDIILTGEIQF